MPVTYPSNWCYLYVAVFAAWLRKWFAHQVTWYQYRYHEWINQCSIFNWNSRASAPIRWKSPLEVWSFNFAGFHSYLNMINVISSRFFLSRHIKSCKLRKEYHANAPNTFNLTDSPWPSGSPAVHRNLCRESQTSNFHHGCIRSCHWLDVVISRKAGRKVLAWSRGKNESCLFWNHFGVSW